MDKRRTSRKVESKAKGKAPLANIEAHPLRSDWNQAETHFSEWKGWPDDSEQPIACAEVPAPFHRVGDCGPALLKELYALLITQGTPVDLGGGKEPMDGTAMLLHLQEMLRDSFPTPAGHPLDDLKEINYFVYAVLGKLGTKPYDHRDQWPSLPFEQGPVLSFSQLNLLKSVLVCQSEVSRLAPFGKPGQSIW